MKINVLFSFVIYLSCFVNAQTDIVLQADSVYGVEGFSSRTLASGWYDKGYCYSSSLFGIKASKNIRQTYLNVTDKLHKNFALQIFPELNNMVIVKPYKIFLEEKNNPYVIQSPVLSFAFRFAPSSYRFLLDSNQVKVNSKRQIFNIEYLKQSMVEEVLRPFYFSKYEVTNKEYRKFVNWVKDSILREELYSKGLKSFKNDKGYINWEAKINTKDTIIVKIYRNALFIGTDKEDAKWKIDKIVYSYKNSISEIVSIPVYPDTTRWLYDVSMHYNEPLRGIQFFHPAYDNHPVTGINYFQCLAYLHWKTQQMQKEFDKKGLKWKISCDLPSEYEWDMVSTAENDLRLYTANYNQWSDNSWRTDLIVSQDTSRHVGSDKESKMSNGIYWELNNTAVFLNGYSIGSSEETNEVDHLNNKQNQYEKKLTKEQLRLIMSNKDVNGICYLGGNVSEWMKDTYSQWIPLFTKHQQLLKQINTEESKIVYNINDYYDKRNYKGPNSHLVRGCNYYDERFSNKLGKNVAGTHAKLFVNPDFSYSTVGFRYVIHIEPK